MGFAAPVAGPSSGCEVSKAAVKLTASTALVARVAVVVTGLSDLQCPGYRYKVFGSEQAAELEYLPGGSQDSHQQ